MPMEIKYIVGFEAESVNTVLWIGGSPVMMIGIARSADDAPMLAGSTRLVMETTSFAYDVANIEYDLEPVDEQELEEIILDFFS